MPFTDTGQCSSFLSTAVTKHHVKHSDPKQLGEEGVYFSLQFTTEDQGHKASAGTEAGTMVDCFLGTCFPWPT